MTHEEFLKYHREDIQRLKNLLFDILVDGSKQEPYLTNICIRIINILEKRNNAPEKQGA